jgi:hypothetical protein
MLTTNIKFPVFTTGVYTLPIKSKRYALYKEQKDTLLYKTSLRDKYKQEIYFFDLLELDGKVSDNITKKKDYFICIWNSNFGRIEFLYFNYEVNDFIWFDNMRNVNFIRISNGIEILQSKKEREYIIPKIILTKVKT